MEQVDGGDAGEETHHAGENHQPPVMFGREAIQDSEHGSSPFTLRVSTSLQSLQS
jgi:hypothetical protein